MEIIFSTNIGYQLDMFPSRHVLCINKHWYLCVLSHFSHIQLFVTLWTVVYQVPLSVAFPRRGYWSGLPFPSTGGIFMGPPIYLISGQRDDAFLEDF